MSVHLASGAAACSPSDALPMHAGSTTECGRKSGGGVQPRTSFRCRDKRWSSWRLGWPRRSCDGTQPCADCSRLSPHRIGVRSIIPQLFSNGPRVHARLYDAIEAGVTAADEERSRLGYTRGEELSEDPAIRKEKHMAQLAEMRRRELRAAVGNIY